MKPYGQQDASFQAAGGTVGIAALVDAFYDQMEWRREARVIRAMHPEDLTLSREKLKVFLASWLGGPSHYKERFGPISIPRDHAHLKIDEPERDAWLLCMQHAVAAQPWAEDFRAYFMREIRVPAERVRVASVGRRAG